MDIIGFEMVVLILWVWFIVWLLIGHEALPDGPILPLLALFTASIVATLISKVRVFNAPVPSLLGMIIVGAVMRNAGAVDSLDNSWSSAIRKIALAIVLTRAGLVLSVEAVLRLLRPTLLLSLMPCLTEATTVAVATRLLLGSPQLPWSWCFMLGFIIAAVSPAVIVPALTDLQQQGYGIAKGIPSMILAAAGIDDVVAVTGFGVAFGISFSSDLAMSIAEGPIDIGMGVASPIVVGYLYSKFVIQDRLNLGLNMYFKSAALLFIGISFVIGYGKLDHTGGGSLAAMGVGIIIQKFSTSDEDKEQIKAANKSLGLVWERVAKPLLFVLIGAAIDISTLTEEVVGLGIAIIALGLIVRLPIVFGCMIGSGLTWQERYFVSVAWLPKATVQAALGSLALDKVEDMDVVDPDQKKWGQRILAISVLAILCTAPLGAVLVEIFGVRWLSNDNDAGVRTDPEAPQIQEKVLESFQDKSAKKPAPKKEIAPKETDSLLRKN